METHWADAYVMVGDDRFHYTHTGNGQKPSLLLLHGFTDNGLCWRPVAEALEADYDVFMPDARGHGLSPRVAAVKELDHAADMAGLITALGLTCPIICGHSMGGATATELGARYPQLVGKLILEDPAWIDPQPNPPPLRENPFFDWVSTVDKLTLDEVIAAGKKIAPSWADSEFLAWATAKQQFDKSLLNTAGPRKPWRGGVAALKTPTLLITADVSRHAIVSQETAHEAASLSPLIQIAHVPKAGHNIRRDNFPMFVNVVKSFLNSEPT